MTKKKWARLSILAAVLSVGGQDALAGGESGDPSPPVAPEVCGAAALPERIQVLVELVDAPTLRVYEASLAASPSGNPAEREAAARAAERAQDQRIKEAQARVARGLAGLGARELYRVRRSFNGMAVVVGSDTLDALRTLSGVKAIYGPEGPRTDGPHTDGPAAVSRTAAGPSESKLPSHPADAEFPAGSGLRAYVDPVTGQLTTTPTQKQGADLDRLLGDLANRSSEGLEVKTLPDGSQIADLQGRFRNFSTASVSAGGAVTLRCNSHAPSSRATTAADPSASPEK